MHETQCVTCLFETQTCIDSSLFGNSKHSLRTSAHRTGCSTVSGGHRAGEAAGRRSGVRGKGNGSFSANSSSMIVIITAETGCLLTVTVNVDMMFPSRSVFLNQDALFSLSK